MKTWAPTETQKTIYAILSSDATLLSLIGNPARVFDNVPQNQPFPYLTMAIKPWTDRGNSSWDGLQAELTINTWARAAGDLTVQTIQKRIDELLHAVDICVDGWDVVSFRRTTVDILTDPDGITLHGVQKFKIMLGEN